MTIDITKKKKISLSKITLDKKGDSHKIDLSKTDDEIIINLNWTKNKGVFGKIFSDDIDLDLGCYYKLRNGVSSVIDGIQFSHNRGGSKNQKSRQGCYIDEPWIWHCGDDRGSNSSSGENILINPNRIENIEKIIVYAFIYDGIVRWEESDAIVTVKIPNNPEIIVEMGKQTDTRGFCAIASIEFNERQISVKKEVTFHEGHAECDKYYGWGFNWSSGSK